MQAVQIHNGFFLVFRRGDDIIAELTRFCEREEVHWAVFEAIGSIEDVVIGYYELAERAYVFQEQPGPFEVVSFKGNVAEVDEGPVVHAHATLSRCDDSLEVIGGHIRSARVSLTLEMILWLVSQPLTRIPDEETGLNLIDFNV